MPTNISLRLLTLALALVMLPSCTSSDGDRFVLKADKILKTDDN